MEPLAVQFDILRWIVLSPLVGAIVISLLGRRLPRKVIGTIGSLAVGISFVIGLGACFKFKGLAGHGHG